MKVMVMRSLSAIRVLATRDRAVGGTTSTTLASFPGPRVIHNETMTTTETSLAATLRLWRDRLTPAEVGLPAGWSRRAAGLRREELADLAGVSVDYVVRLEQGRATTPSAQVWRRWRAHCN